MLNITLAHVTAHSSYSHLLGYMSAFVLVVAISRPGEAAEAVAGSSDELLRAVIAAFDANYGLLPSVHFRYSVTRRDFTVDAPVEQIVTIPGDPPSKAIIRTSPESVRYEDTWVVAHADREHLRTDRRQGDDALSEVFAYDGSVWRWWQPANREMRVYRQSPPIGMLPIDPRKHGVYEFNDDLPRKLQRGSIVRSFWKADGQLVLHIESLHDDWDGELPAVEQRRCHFDSGLGLLPTSVTTLWNGVRSSDVLIRYQQHESSGMYVPSRVAYRFFGDDGEELTEETVYQLLRLESAPSLGEAFFAVADVAVGTVIFDEERGRPYEHRPLPQWKNGWLLWFLLPANLAVVIILGFFLRRRRRWA